MAALGPVPAMVSKEMSRSALVAARSASSFLTTAISVSEPGACASSHARKRTMAQASRRWAARVPSSSASFLQALGRMQGSSPSTGFDSASCTATGQEAGSMRTVPSRAFSAGTNSSGAWVRTEAPRWSPRSVSFSGAMNRSTVASAFSRAKPCGTGFFGMSEPRMFRSHARLSGRVMTAASAGASVLASRAILSSCASPASSSGWAKTAPMGGSGWSSHSRSMRFAIGTSVSFGSFSARRRCSATVSSHGS